nr:MULTISPECIES: hypothetical protein [unclassified Mycolicibacterium]
MLGGRVQLWDTESAYSDIPTALVHLLEALDAWLTTYVGSPPLDDPSCPGVSFGHRWDDPVIIANFKSKIADYARWAREAYDLQGIDDAAALVAWQKLFGPEFAADEVKATRNDLVAAKVTRELAARVTVLPPADIAPDEEFIHDRYPVSAPRYSANIEATIIDLPRNNFLRKRRVVPKRRDLQFYLHTDTPEPYEVLWKVRNHGPEAARVAGGLRGQIRVGGNKTRNTHNESTLYRGSHYVEAYVVRDGVVVASDHHTVTIE